MRTLETSRLVLRKFTTDDFAAAYAYASRADNTIYMLWGPNTEDDTRAFIDLAIGKAERDPIADYQYAVVVKETAETIGGCEISVSGCGGSLGWILRRDQWNRGYCTEIGNALLDFGFGGLGLHRITACCDAENAASYRVMEKIGMRREGFHLDARPANKKSERKYGDEYLYAILADEYEIRKEIARYNSLTLRFDGFVGVPELTDGVVRLIYTAKKPAVPEKKLVPAYEFAVCAGGEKVGGINLRIGYTDALYYGGQIGYNTDEEHRGNGYATRACKLLARVAEAHGMTKLLITNDPSNVASRRVCEKLGARLVRMCRIPEWHDLYREDRRFVNIFEWSIG